MPPTLGTGLGPYQIIDAIGSGGMGEVYRARDPRLGRDVAIKVLPAAFSTDPDRLRRFEQEARAAAALNHPNILAVYDIGVDDDGSPYIVSELLEGHTLRELLGHGSGVADSPSPDSARARSGNASRLSARKALQYAIQLARGLAVAHDKGIVHRDLKPENVFITTDEQVKILDFGLAKLVERESGLATPPSMTAVETQPGMLLGTIGYVAPEQVRGQNVDHRADIFAFGAILYEMLSGQRAFAAPTAADTIGAILEANPPDLRLNDHIPPALARLVDRCLEKSPAARFQSTRDLVFALEALDAPSSTSIPSAPEIRQGSRERLAWLVAAISLIAVLLAIAMIFIRPAPPAAAVSLFDITTPPTDDPVAFALSSDGRQLAFVATAEGKARLWLRSLASVSPRSLPGTDDASYPFWAPDGRAIGFFADGKLKRIELTGGQVQVLADAPVARGGSWNQQGDIVFAPGITSGLMRVAANGGTPTPVTDSASGRSHRHPYFLPDGRRFLFLMTQGPLNTQGIYVGSIDGGEPTYVITADTAPAYASPGYLLGVSQGVLIAYPFDPTRGTVGGGPTPLAQPVGVDVGERGAFSVSDAGALVYRSTGTIRRQLTWVDRSGTQLGVLGPPDEWSPSNPELAPNGQHVALYRRVQQNADVWLIDIQRAITSRITTDPTNEAGAIWSSEEAM